MITQASSRAWHRGRRHQQDSRCDIVSAAGSCRRPRLLGAQFELEREHSILVHDVMGMETGLSKAGHDYGLFWLKQATKDGRPRGRST
jgi:hypothetical protein